MRRQDFKDASRYVRMGDLTLEMMEANGRSAAVEIYGEPSTGRSFQLRVHAELYRVAPPAQNMVPPPYGPWLPLDP